MTKQAYFTTAAVQEFLTVEGGRVSSGLDSNRDDREAQLFTNNSGHAYVIRCPARSSRRLALAVNRAVKPSTYELLT